MTNLHSEIFGQGKRYYTFSRYLKDRFGEKVWKIPVHANLTCPNRDGTVGTGGCIYCNNDGFSPAIQNDHQSIDEQIRAGIQRIQRKRKISKFVVYFQTYSNTYSSLPHLKQLYDSALNFDQVVGLAIGTRPDCVNEKILDLIESYTPRLEVWLEYGLQSKHNSTLAAINRGHSYRDFLSAVELTRKRNLKICVHVIIGLPYESPEMIMGTADALAEIGIDAIKIHPMQVHKNTKLEKIYNAGRTDLFSREEYVEILCDFLERLPENVIIQRLTAEAPADILVAPEWCLNKMKVLEAIDNELLRRDSWQGSRFKTMRKNNL